VPVKAAAAQCCGSTPDLTAAALFWTHSSRRYRIGAALAQISCRRGEADANIFIKIFSSFYATLKADIIAQFCQPSFV